MYTNIYIYVLKPFIDTEALLVDGEDRKMEEQCYEVRILQSHTTITFIQSQDNIYYKTLNIYIQATLVVTKS